MATSPILTGAKVVLYVNGVLFAKINSFRFDVATPRKEIRGIDSMLPFEEAMTTTKVTGSMSVYRLVADGAAEGAGMVATQTELPREKYFTMVLIDIVSNSVIFQADSCSVESQTWTFDTRNLAMGQISWTALQYNNEVRPVG